MLHYVHGRAILPDVGTGLTFVHTECVAVECRNTPHDAAYMSIPLRDAPHGTTTYLTVRTNLQTADR